MTLQEQQGEAELIAAILAGEIQMVTDASTWASGRQAVEEHVTELLAAVRFAASRISVMRASAGPLLNVGLLGSGGGVTTPTRAASRTALVAILAVSHARLSSRDARKMISSVGKTTMNSRVEVPR